ncbi:CD4-1 molecule precursor [Ictalurus punctatus]|uniref:CD4-1 molecule precursor n=1 Tax=Ictalurus punctatus TaxID=7998 RepID=Q1W651_ICTPU|nr:CD4-1 molecule precursor [Ictalurus punctatus]ABD93351.1 CD4-like protein 1 [Ictalurus punctatus]
MSFLLGLLLLLAPCHSAADEPKGIFAQFGNSVTLPRRIWGIEGKIHVNWYFQDNLLISRNPTLSASKTVHNRFSLSSDSSLIISNVEKSDFGIFKCEQHHLVETITDTYKLYEVMMSTPPPLLVGASLDLSCEIESEGFKLVHEIKWFGPDNTLYVGSSSSNQRTLRVTKVSSIHSGKWTCAVRYGASITLKARTDVIIVDLASSSPDPIYTSDSSINFLIPCSLSSKIPWSTVNATGVTGGSWHFTPFKSSESSLPLLKLQLNPSPAWKFPSGTHTLLMETDLKNHELGVKISKVSINERGNYTCSLEFGSRTLSRSVQVEVLQVISSEGKVIYEGNTVNLTCTLGHHMTPDLEVNWIPPYGSSLSKLSPPYTTMLSIPGVSVKDSGRWTCQLKKNATLLTSATISLKIEKAPVNIWLVVAIIGGLLVFILIAVITVFIIRRHRQMMRYRCRKGRVCCCKNPKPKGFYKT